MHQWRPLDVSIGGKGPCTVRSYDQVWKGLLWWPPDVTSMGAGVPMFHVSGPDLGPGSHFPCLGSGWAKTGGRGAVQQGLMHHGNGHMETPMNKMTDRYDWKHYLPTTSLVVVTRKHSSRICTTHLCQMYMLQLTPDLNTCGRVPEVNKFEQIFHDGHQMSLGGGQGQGWGSLRSDAWKGLRPGWGVPKVWCLMLSRPGLGPLLVSEAQCRGAGWGPYNVRSNAWVMVTCCPRR